MVGDLDLAGGEPGTDSPGVLPADGLEAMVRTGIGFTQCRRSLTTGSMTRRRHPFRPSPARENELDVGDSEAWSKESITWVW